VSVIVLRRRDSGESDRRLTVLTRELGKIDVIAKGARKGGSRLAGSSDPLAVAVMSLAEGKRNLYVTQAQPLSSFRGLRTDFDRLTFALAFVELCAAVLPYEQPVPEAFDLLRSVLQAIEAHEKPVVALVWGELQLMSIAGFLPQFDRSAVSDTPVGEAEPYLSPNAGGYVADHEAREFSDRFRTKAEVLYGLARTAELETPPANLKLADEALVALLPFWRAIAETPLPANEACVAEIRHTHL
jgi:DNA repair protein RecO